MELQGRCEAHDNLRRGLRHHPERAAARKRVGGAPIHAACHALELSARDEPVQHHPGEAVLGEVARAYEPQPVDQIKDSGVVAGRWSHVPFLRYFFESNACSERCR